MSKQFEEICKSVTESLSRRDSRRDILAGRIRQITQAALDAARRTKIVVAGWTIRSSVDLHAPCCQGGANSGWPIYDHHEDHPVMICNEETRSLGPVPDLGYHDGNNMQYQCGAVRDEGGGTVRPATVAQLRAVARALPAAVAAMLDTTRTAAETEAVEAAEEVARLATE